MPAFSASILTGAGSATLPMCALVGNGSVRAIIREIGWSAASTAAPDVTLCRISTAGTPGSNATSQLIGAGTAAANSILKGTYTSTAPTTIIGGHRWQAGASIGSGIVWTFPSLGLVIDNVANAGVGLIPASGTGGPVVAYYVWEE